MRRVMPSPRPLEIIEAAGPCDTVVDATPVALAHLVRVDKPLAQVDYELRERGPGLGRARERLARRISGQGRGG